MEMEHKAQRIVIGFLLLALLGCNRPSVATGKRSGQDLKGMLVVEEIDGLTRVAAQWDPADSGQISSRQIFLNLTGEPWDASGSDHYEGQCFINFYPTAADFKLMLEKSATHFGRFEDVTLGNIPGLSDGKYDYWLTPGAYFYFFCSIGIDEKKSFPSLYPKVLKSISWAGPIDANSQEFKAWKAHIFALIDEARQPAVKKSILSP